MDFIKEAVSIPLMTSLIIIVEMVKFSMDRLGKPIPKKLKPYMVILIGVIMGIVRALAGPHTVETVIVVITTNIAGAVLVYDTVAKPVIIPLLQALRGLFNGTATR